MRSEDVLLRQKVLKEDCKLDRGESKYHYVDRLANHFYHQAETICETDCNSIEETENGKLTKAFESC